MAETNATQIGTFVLAALAVGQLFQLFDSWKEKKKRRNGEGWVTRHEFRELTSKFDLFISERRRDMDFLLSQLGSVRATTGTLSGRIRVLYVEDNDHDRVLFRREMATMFEIHEAATMSQALTMMQHEKYDVVLLDLNLPDCSGEETLRTFRSQCPSACAMVVSGNSNPKLVQLSYDMGFESTIFKDPIFDGKEFASKITAAVLRHRKIK